MPFTIVGLHLCDCCGLLTYVFEIVVEPVVEFYGPIHSTHVRVGFCTISTTQPIVSVGLVWIVVRPLSDDGPSVNTSIVQQSKGWECMIRVNVPILESPYEVDTALIVVEYILEMVSLIPVIVPLISTHSSTKPSCER